MLVAESGAGASVSGVGQVLLFTVCKAAVSKPRADLRHIFPGWLQDGWSQVFWLIAGSAGTG